MSGLSSSGFVLSSFGFFRRRRVFFSRDRDQVVTGHPLARACFAGSFSFSRPAASVCFARFGRASCFLVVFRGAILAPRVFGILLELTGLDLARVFLCFCCLVFCFPLCFVLRPHFF